MLKFRSAYTTAAFMQKIRSKCGKEPKLLHKHTLHYINISKKGVPTCQKWQFTRSPVGQILERQSRETDRIK